MMGNIRQIDGYPVVDADEPLVLEVKQLDVKRGEPQTPECCAIARACKRSLEIIEARVHLSRTYLRTSNGEWLRYFTPQSARTEIVAFDRGGGFQPRTFVFPAPPLGNRLGDRAGYQERSHKRTNKKRTPAYHMEGLRTWAKGDGK
jgi:hypothetical protein